MKKAFFERSLAALLFVLVLIVFTLAHRDTQKLLDQYNSRNVTAVEKKAGNLTAEVAVNPQGK